MLCCTIKTTSEEDSQMNPLFFQRQNPAREPRSSMYTSIAMFTTVNEAHIPQVDLVNQYGMAYVSIYFYCFLSIDLSSMRRLAPLLCKASA